jgi:hypothetical protein
LLFVNSISLNVKLLVLISPMFNFVKTKGSVPPKPCVALRSLACVVAPLREAGKGRRGVILSSLCSDLREMAPVPISNMKPIVKITKNSTATQNP